MKTLIAFASKTGTTEKCAHTLSTYFENATLCNLTNEQPDLSDYETVIIGGSIRMGQLHKKTKQFILDNQDILLEKRCAFYICNGIVDQTEEVIQRNFPTEIINHTLLVDTFGGEIDLQKQKGLDRMIAKIALKSIGDDPSKQPKILEENIETFAEAVQA
ncbi:MULTISPECIES: flavodoxin domain-containing protein [Bacillus]|uniref:flavodoxin domain-containing protein n=1 Tax=Bacillus TaxID=1386 RepID=UPI00030AE937|nr:MULTISPECIES: flavodoxin domain-containing protein [Bacillus]